MSELRYALRVLISRPGFSSVAILTMALGSGANTAIFTIVNAVLLHTLPFSDSDRLMLIVERNGPFVSTIKYRKPAHIASKLRNLWNTAAGPWAVPSVASGKGVDADPDFGGSCSKMDLACKAEVAPARTRQPR